MIAASARSGQGACAPLALPTFSPAVDTTVASDALSEQNAALCRFLIASGHVQEQHLPDACADPVEACAHAIDGWIKSRIGPLHCLQPRFAASVLDAHGHYPAFPRDGQQAAYAHLDLYWCEYQEAEWPIGPRLEALEAAAPGLGATVLQILRAQASKVYPLFTPDLADSAASYVYWQGEDNEEAALDMLCDEGEQVDREALRADMVTRAMLDDAYPVWARQWLSHRQRCGGHGNQRGPWRPRRLRAALKTVDPALRQIVADARALSRLPLDDTFAPEVDGEFVGYGAVLSWREGDVTTRIYDDLMNLAHESEFCDRMGEFQLSLDHPDAFGVWMHRMDLRFEAIRLIDRLIHGLSSGD